MNYQFTSRLLTMDNLSMSNQGHMTFKRLYLLKMLNAASYQILHETHIVNPIWYFSLPHDISPWVALKDQIKVSGCSLGCVS